MVLAWRTSVIADGLPDAPTEGRDCSVRWRGAVQFVDRGHDVT